MKDELVEIKISKATLYLTVGEILDNIPNSLKMLGLKRGKAIKRSQQTRKRAADFDSPAWAPQAGRWLHWPKF